MRRYAFAHLQSPTAILWSTSRLHYPTRPMAQLPSLSLGRCRPDARFVRSLAGRWPQGTAATRPLHPCNRGEAARAGKYQTCLLAT